MSVFDNFIDIHVSNNMHLVGLNDEFFCIYLLNLLKREKKSILVVVNSIYEANCLYSSLGNYSDCVNLFPMDDFLTSEALAISPDLKLSRLSTINSIINDVPQIVITNLMGYLRFLPNRKTYENAIINLKVGDSFNPKTIVEKLLLSGYTRVTVVTKTGEFAVRGFVVDVFPIDEDNPVRVEFFGDDIDSIRYFNPATQKSFGKIDGIFVKPCSEFILDRLVNGNFNEKNKMLPKYVECVSVYNYFKDCFVVFKDYEQLANSYKNICEDIELYRKSKDEEFTGKYMFRLDDIKPNFTLHYLSIDNLVDDSKNWDIVNFNIKTIDNFSENADLINNYLRKCIIDGKTVIICLKDYQIKSIIKKLNMKINIAENDKVIKNFVNIIDLGINSGFIYGDYVVLSAKELFLFRDKPKKYSNKFKYSTSISDISKIKTGDYVVHNVHGIGIYNGIKTLSVSGFSKDYLEVLYHGSDKIYIPVEKIELLHKYSAKEGVIPKINKLGTLEWEKTKLRVRKKIDDMTDKLLSLYAERELQKGFAFSADCDLSEQFLADFPYDLTKDQVRAIEQIKADMEKNTPMDRLLCGDVGFGKTEVAFVAAFKAILDSKQVLFLCPTTILSNQHYENAKDRFKNFPVSIALLNRFTPKYEVKRVLSGLKEGTIDLVFGTHRLLSDDVVVKDLGLLIVDEEQRFGVRHKEKLKQYKNNVDVLTLTATPIPRTLQMSLVGIRGLSLIETPPINRYPVQTYVIEENSHIIRDSIYKELSREGQVFILYNKVKSIVNEVEKIKKLVPDARVGMAHGQMNKDELESQIFDFINRCYDVLVCTTIIETGIDIPNVNTLIVIDADCFGLSQLYQIRGRVGRSDKFAYAYLMYNPKKILNEVAIKRLNVIKEFTELGSGFAIATRDLSIRGAGDILGSEQAGFIDSVGIDLYLKMLNEEIDRRKNAKIEQEEESEDSSKPLINVATHIEDSYVKEDELKIEIHKKINEIDSKEKLVCVKEELEDRFGKISEDLVIYMHEEWFEKLAKNIGVRKVIQNRNSIEMYFDTSILSLISIEVLFEDAFQISSMFRFKSSNNHLIIVLDIIKLEKHPIYYLVSLLDKISNKITNTID